jgi:hypothetical protein
MGRLDGRPIEVSVARITFFLVALLAAKGRGSTGDKCADDQREAPTRANVPE